MLTHTVKKTSKNLGWRAGKNFSLKSAGTAKSTRFCTQSANRIRGRKIITSKKFLTFSSISKCKIAFRRQCQPIIFRNFRQRVPIQDFASNFLQCTFRSNRFLQKLVSLYCQRDIIFLKNLFLV